MKKILIGLLLSLILISEISGVSSSQDSVLNFSDLAEEMKMLWLAYGINPTHIRDIDIAQFNGTPDEAVELLEELLKKSDKELPEMEPFENKLGDVIKNTISLAGEGLGEEWLELAEKRAVELANVTQTSYIFGIETDEGPVQFNIDMPFLSPLTLEVYEGTYIVTTELVGESRAAELEELFGEEISLDSELPEKYLKGSWTIKKRELHNKYETQVPEVVVEIADYIGSIEETEIDAERFLFRGQVRINDLVYEAYTELDSVNMYAYPICFISVLKEKGRASVFEIWLEDLEEDLRLNIFADFKQVFEKALAVKVGYDYDRETYETDDDEVDYLMR